jgi:hypothetical protein
LTFVLVSWVRFITVPLFLWTPHPSFRLL